MKSQSFIQIVLAMKVLSDLVTVAIVWFVVTIATAVIEVYAETKKSSR